MKLSIKVVPTMGIPRTQPQEDRAVFSAEAFAEEILAPR